LGTLGCVSEIPQYFEKQFVDPQSQQRFLKLQNALVNDKRDALKAFLDSGVCPPNRVFIVLQNVREFFSIFLAKNHPFGPNPRMMRSPNFQIENDPMQPIGGYQWKEVGSPDRLPWRAR
jgi:hypothetical protein